MSLKRNVIVTELEIAILTVLYKYLWALDFHIAILIDEPLDYVTARLKQMAQGGLIERYQMGPSPACNYITSKGISELGSNPRSVRKPSFYTFEHALAEADLFTWLCLPRKGLRIQLGDIVTERDICANRERIPAGIRNGRSVSIPADRGIHCPDGYVYIGNRLCALEVERILKSKSSRTQMEANIADLRLRFDSQIWCYEKEAVGRMLENQRQVYGDELILFSIEDVRREISEYMCTLPVEISKKSGRKRRDLIGEIRETTPLNKLEIIRCTQRVELEVWS